MFDTLLQICSASQAAALMLVFNAIAIPLLAVYLFIKVDPFWLRKHKPDGQSEG